MGDTRKENHSVLGKGGQNEEENRPEETENGGASGGRRWKKGSERY